MKFENHSTFNAHNLTVDQISTVVYYNSQSLANSDKL